MALFVYVTPNCEEEARTHSLWPEVERFRDRVEATQSTSLFDPFPQPYLVKKKLGGRQGRLIARRQAVGEHAAIVFLSVMMRGHHAYEDEFSKSPIEYGDQHFADAVEDEVLETYIESRTRTSPPPPKAEPNDVEYDFLYSAFSHHDTTADEIVCETRRWVEQIAQERIADRLVLLCKPLDGGSGRCARRTVYC